MSGRGENFLLRILVYLSRYAVSEPFERLITNIKFYKRTIEVSYAIGGLRALDST